MIDLYQRVVLALTGVTLLSVTATGRYQNYLKPSAAPLLLLTAVVLLVLALHGSRRAWTLLSTALRGPGPASPPAAGTAWALLLLPLLCLWILKPPALGSFTADRAVNAVSVQRAGADPDLGWPPLPAGDVVPLTFGEFIERATWDSRRSLTGRTVRLTGFVVQARAGQGQGTGAPWGLARLAIACCAADALVFRVAVQDGRPVGERTVPMPNDWVEVQGTWVPEPVASFDHTPGDPTLVVTDLVSVPQPAQPYE